MRLTVDAEIQPDTIGRLHALTPDLEIVDRSQDATFDATALVDPEVHASGVTMRYFDDFAVENVPRYLAGGPLLNLVDAERGY